MNYNDFVKSVCKEAYAYNRRLFKMADNITSIFGSNVFNDSVMRNRLPEKVYKEFRKTVKTGAPLQEEVADVIAKLN